MAITQSGYRDAQTTNASNRSVRLYKDLALSFERNDNTKDIIVKKDIEAVKQSVRNLILTNHFERPFHPEIGSNLRAMLFENITPQMTHALSKQIDLLIKNFEPRAKLVQINVQPFIERNGYRASISFFVVNTPERVEMESFLERLR